MLKMVAPWLPNSPHSPAIPHEARTWVSSMMGRKIFRDAATQHVMWDDWEPISHYVAATSRHWKDAVPISPKILSGRKTWLRI